MYGNIINRKYININPRAAQLIKFLIVITIKNATAMQSFKGKIT